MRIATTSALTRTKPVRDAEKAPASSTEAQLQAWLRQRGLPQQRVHLADCSHQGRGLVASQSIRQGEALLRVPEAVLLTADVAQQGSRLGPLLERADLPAWSVFATFLTETAADSKSVWAPYAGVLPASTGCVLEWSAQEVGAVQGSMRKSAAEVLEATARSIEELDPLVEQAETDGLVRKGVLSKKRLRWAFGILLSRLVRLPGRRNTEALVPWADFLNHDCSCNCHIDYDAATSSVVMAPDRPYSQGQQVMTSYGHKTSGELLLSYGFLPSPGTNLHDACHLSLRIAADDPRFGAKLEALAEYGLASPQRFPLKASALPAGAKQYAAFAEADCQADEVAELAAYLFGQGMFPVVDGVDTEVLGIEVLLDEAKVMLAGFTNSLEQEQALLERLRADQLLAGAADSIVPETNAARLASIVAVRLQEQKILHRTAFVLRQQRRELAS